MAMGPQVCLSPIKEEAFFVVETQDSESETVSRQVEAPIVPNFLKYLLRQRKVHAQQSKMWPIATTEELLKIHHLRPTSLKHLKICLPNFKCCGDPLCPFWPSVVKAFCADHALSSDFTPAKTRHLPEWMQNCVPSPSLQASTPYRSMNPQQRHKFLKKVFNI